MIRPATVEDLPSLNPMILRSKAHWGYDAAFMAACRDVLRLTSRDLETSDIVVFANPLIQGVCKLEMEGEAASLDKLFVEPAAMGKGVGRALMRWAIDRARDRNASHMMIEADPGAAPFYERMGARVVGEVASEAIVERSLPLLRLDLPGLAPAADRSI